MIADHIKYLKSIIETKITGRDGTGTPLAGKFYEIYPPAATIRRSLPCACCKSISGKTSFAGGFDRAKLSGNLITRVRKTHEVESTWQIDFYSKDIYDFLERDETYTGFLNQFIQLVTEFYRATDPAGNAIEFEPGTCGVIDDENVIVDGIYMAYCRVKAIDGIYSVGTVPALPGGEDNIIISEEIHGR